MAAAHVDLMRYSPDTNDDGHDDINDVKDTNWQYPQCLLQHPGHEQQYPS